MVAHVFISICVFLILQKIWETVEISIRNNSAHNTTFAGHEITSKVNEPCKVSKLKANRIKEKTEKFDLGLYNIYW